ncbi:Trypsin-like peptidase domain-containing protein [Rhizobiales bacterium GAS191]|nr:Trypsin-like peptidase domain-containing protein [Rhizobiales bacterium GAS191]
MIGANVVKGRTSRAIDSVCRIEINGKPTGTGFLVGPDSVLTNFHVVEKVLGGDNKFTAVVSCLFDFAEAETGGVDAGTPIGVASPCLDWSRYGAAENTSNPSSSLPEADELDYALLKLDDAVGNRPAPGAWRKRGWITIPAKAPNLSKDSPLIIIQHPLTGPKVTDRQDKGVVGLNPRNNRLIYVNETHPGSSGAPCLTADYELVALHHYGDPKWVAASRRQGVPIWLIRDSLVAHGYGASIPDYRDDVNMVEGFLGELSRVLHDGEVGAKAARWREDIVKANDGVARLTAYKGMHDFLHRWQKQLPMMMEAAERIDRDAFASRWLALEGQNVVDDCGGPRDCAGKLPPGIRGGQEEQLRWIDEIVAAASVLTNTLAGQPNARFAAAVQIRNIVRFQLANINYRLVDEAANLPLNKLVTAFRDLASSQAIAGSADDQTEGVLALQRLQDALHGRVDEHNRWQLAEHHLWGLEDISVDAESSRKIYVATWCQAWDVIQRLCAEDKMADWSRRIVTTGSALSKLLEAAEWLEVREAFTDFRRFAADRFRQVDTRLLEECEEIVTLGNPLTALVGGRI